MASQIHWSVVYVWWFINQCQMVSLNEWLMWEQVKHENLYNKIIYRWYCFRIIKVPWDGKGVFVFLIKHIYQSFLIYLWIHIHMRVSRKLTSVGLLFPINVFVVRFQVGRWWSLPYFRFFLTPKWSLIKCICENPLKGLCFGCGT